MHRWKVVLDALLGEPIVSTNFLENVALATGQTVINHKLGRVPQGWFIVDINGAATIYRSAPFNELTLTLTSSGTVTVKIGVF
jgi:hypothetical protein